MVADARNKPPLIDERTDNISTHGPVGNAASARRAMRGVSGEGGKGESPTFE